MPKKIFLKQLFKVAFILTIFAVLIVWNPRSLFSPFREIFARTNYAFQKIFSTIGGNTGGFFDFLSSISSLKDENADLLKENNSLVSQLTLLREEKKENEILRKQLELSPKNKFNLENAFVIGQDPQRLGSWIIIDKGSSSGITVGMPVIVSDGILVGKIEETSGISSKVSLLTNSTSIVNAADLNSEARGILRGEYGLGILLDLVSQEDILSNGDDVITSGLGGDMPRGLFIGKIQEFGVSSDKLFQQAVVIPRVKYSDLRMVSVIKN